MMFPARMVVLNKEFMEFMFMNMRSVNFEVPAETLTSQRLAMDPIIKKLALSTGE